MQARSSEEPVAVQQMLVLSNYYYVSLLPPVTETGGGIVLPETAVIPAYDGIVLARGPGRILSSGARYPLQADVGDRVIVQPWKFAPYPGNNKPETGFVTDEDLVAIKRFNRDQDWDPLAPAGDYVLVDPDPVADVRLSDNGVAIASHILGGGELRERQRGEELYWELRRLADTPRWRDQPGKYWQHRVVWDFLEGLSRWEIEALQKAVDRGGDTGWKSLRKITLRQQPTSGTVVCNGPGTVLPGGTRITGTESVAPGDRVHWTRFFAGVWLCDDGKSLLAVPSKYIEWCEKRAVNDKS